jgi:hypothetical protein
MMGLKWISLAALGLPAASPLAAPAEAKGDLMKEEG